MSNHLLLNNNNLPSVDDYIVLSENLPSINEKIVDTLPTINDFFIEESAEEEKLKIINCDLPSIEDFLIEENIEEVEEVEEDIREDVISEEYITLEDLVLMIEDVKNNIPEIPEIRYYEKPLSELNERINLLPEIKHYDSQIQDLQQNLENIKNLIPKIPEWVNEEFYSSIIKSITKFESDINFVIDKIDIVKFENKVDSGNLKEKIEEYDIFKNDVYNNIEILSNDLISLHKKLKISEEKILENIPKVPEFPEIKYYDDDIEILKDSISSLNEKILEIKISDIPKFPEIKYYDEDIKNLYDNIKELGEKIKFTEEKLEEHKTTKEIEIIKEEIKEDPLTSTNFATLDDLKNHYTLFINRIQQQLASIGGGGETQLKYLDDVVGIATNASAYDNKFLKYNHSIGKFEFASVGAGSQNLDDTLQLGNTSSLGMSVGVTTVTSLNIDTVAYFDTNTITINSSSPTQIYSFSASQYRSARIQIQITQGTDYQTSDVLVIHNGTNANLVEYASISTNDYLGTFDAVVSSGNVSLQVLMASASSATVKIVSQVIVL